MSFAATPFSRSRDGVRIKGAPPAADLHELKADIILLENEIIGREKRQCAYPVGIEQAKACRGHDRRRCEMGEQRAGGIGIFEQGLPERIGDDQEKSRAAC